ncbi:hypothetical protein I3843_08G165600 [Carya illinoinensis]|nr:hypothetical protein I3843_08G165600 [Carya illinoinensis]
MIFFLLFYQFRIDVACGGPVHGADGLYWEKEKRTYGLFQEPSTSSSQIQAHPFPLSSLPFSQTAEPFVQNLRRPNPSFLDLFLSLRFENHRLPVLFLSLRSAFRTESLSSAATHFSASNQ